MAKSTRSNIKRQGKNIENICPKYHSYMNTITNIQRIFFNDIKIFKNLENKEKTLRNNSLRYEIKFNFLHERNIIKSMLKFCFSPTTLTKQQKLENWKGCDKTDIYVLCITRMNIIQTFQRRVWQYLAKLSFVISITFLLRTYTQSKASL